MQNTTKPAPDRGFRSLLRSSSRWYAALSLIGLALRLFFVVRLPYITLDGVVYGSLAKNWLLHHVYGLGDVLPITPTYIRLPGYPAFMAAVWKIAGLEHYNAIRFAQVAIDMATCFVVADLARRVACSNFAQVTRWAFALTALCPFLANYTAVPLTETPAICLTAAALDCAVAGLTRLAQTPPSSTSMFGWWALCGLAIAGGIYLRPDGGVVLIAIGGYLLFGLLKRQTANTTLLAGVLLAAFAFGPLLPWAVRNWRVFHEFQPLAPTHANAPGEFYAGGFDDWMRTWLIDYASLEDIGFKADSEDFDINLLPGRAFDPDERQRTEAIFEAYNQTDTMTPEIDSQFAQLARERANRHPLRTHLGLPLLRALDLWLRPRTEMLPVATHWWQFQEDPRDSAWALLLALINAAYLLLAIFGFARWRQVEYAGMLLGFVLLRTIIITAITFPEPRYVLECYPVVIVFAAVGLAGRSRRMEYAGRKQVAR